MAPGAMTAGEGWENWTGRTGAVTDQVSLARAQAMLATLGRDPGGLGEGDSLPPLFHWMYCWDVAPSGALDVDGHQKRGDFLPDLPLRRRMWAGGRLRFEGAMRIGEAVRRRSTIRAVTPKQGRSGPLILVTIEHRLRSAAGTIVEEQDLVFLERRSQPEPTSAPAPASGSAPALGSSAASGPAPATERVPAVGPASALGWPPVSGSETERSESVTPDVAMLFRFSALTFNAHRIHYDRDFARDVEGYPDLVVHGPLTALLLADLAVRRTGRPLMSLNFRARRPLFVDRPITLRASHDPSPEPASEVRLQALDHEGALAMTATATLG